MEQSRKISLTLDTFFKVQCAEFFKALGCEVETEVELFKLPRRLDVLIIKKQQQKQHKQPEFKILDYFKKYNLVSYKSFRDRFAISDIRDAVSYLQIYLNSAPEADESNSTISLIVSRKPAKFLKAAKSKVYETIKGRYVVDYGSFQLYVLNLEEIVLGESLDGIFLSEFVKDKQKIALPTKLQNLVMDQRYNKKIVDILREGLQTRLVAFEGGQIEMGAVADITKYVLPELEKAEARGEAKGKIEAARVMLTKGYPLQDVVEITGLNQAQLKKAGLVDDIDGRNNIRKD